MDNYFTSGLLLLLFCNASKASLIGGTCGQNMSRIFAERLVYKYADRLDDGFKDCALTCVKNVACESFSHVQGSCRQYQNNRNGNQAQYDDRCKNDDDCSYEHGHCLRGACSCSIGYSYDFGKHFCVRGNQAQYDDRCKNDDDCSYKHGHCLRGACSCSIGYSYDFEKNFCVSECASYGSRFSVYNNTGIVSCNIKSLTKQSLRSCTNACRDEVTFVCISAEFLYGHGQHHGYCNFCDITWADILPTNRHVGIDKGWTLSYRHCQ